MKLLDNLVPAPTPAGKAIQRYLPPAWMQPYLPDGMPPGLNMTYGRTPAEPIGDAFADYVIHGLFGNTVIAAVERVRIGVFSEARFQFQRMQKGRPGNLFGTADLLALERPWVGGTTGDLLARMLLDADFAGNSFWVEIDAEMCRLRPDWVDIILTERWHDGGRYPDGEPRQVGWNRLAYVYYEGGRNSGRRPAVFLPAEVVHFAPRPDPLATWRGMSWLTPTVREIQADTMATRHKLKFFENAATPNLAVSLPKEIPPDEFTEFVDLMEATHTGVENAYRTLYTGGGADVTVVGADMRQLDFKSTQGAGETRICAAGGIHPSIVGVSEGLQGSSLNAGNFGAARRLAADVTFRPLWRNAAGSLEVLIPPPVDGRLWYDDRDVAFLREDAKDAAVISQIQAATIRTLVEGGFAPDTAIAAVLAQNMDLLVHTGLVSVQLQPPNTAPKPLPSSATAPTPAAA